MKQLYINYRYIIIFLLFSSLEILISCSTSRKSALSCPRIPDARFNYKARHETNNKSIYNLFSFKKPGQHKHASFTTVNSSQSSLTGATNSAKEMEIKADQMGEYCPGRIDIDKNEYLTGLTASIDKNMLEIHRHILTGSSASEKSKASNGTHDLFNSSDQSDNISSADEKQMEGLGVAGFAFGIAGIFVLGALFGLIGVIFGVISLVRMKRNPDRYKGKWYAIASIALGIIDITLVLVLLL
jgi:hypothetical protein